MKNAFVSIAFFLFLFLHQAGAQIQNTWVGGTPGRPLDWNTAANWSLQRVPNAFHDVVIPNTESTTFSYPVIDDAVELHTLRIESGAKLVILETGTLQLNGIGPKMSDILANAGKIENRSPNLIGFGKSVESEIGAK